VEIKREEHYPDVIKRKVSLHFGIQEILEAHELENRVAYLSLRNFDLLRSCDRAIVVLVVERAYLFSYDLHVI